MTNEQIIQTLNGLIQTNRDGENGYTAVAEKTDNATLRAVYIEHAEQRATFATELSNFVVNMGGDPNDTSSILGTLHRGWLDIRTALAGDEENVILDEIVRGEKVAVSNYETALQGVTFPEEIQRSLQQQLSSIRMAHDRIEAMQVRVDA